MNRRFKQSTGITNMKIPQNHNKKNPCGCVTWGQRKSDKKNIESQGK